MTVTRPPFISRHAGLSALAATLVFLSGCSREDAPTAPTGPAVPKLEMRADLGTYARLDPVDVLGVSARGRILSVKVGYAGGCVTHTLAPIGGLHFLSSYPATYDIIIRHDSGGDACEAYLTETLQVDVSPVIEHYIATFGKLEPFYLRILPPDVSSSTHILVH